MGCANASCKSCQVTCKTSQAYCKINKENAYQVIGKFEWKNCVAQNEFIFKGWSASEWNRLQEWIRKAYNYNAHGSNSPPSMTPASSDSNSPDSLITAKKYNEIVAALKGLKAGSPQTVKGASGGELGDIIRSYHATNLSTGAYEAKFVNENCDNCHANCDQGCHACEGCVSCQGQLHYSTCYGSCYGSTGS